MKVEVEFGDGSSGPEMPERPDLVDENMSVMQLELGESHLKRMPNLRPGMKVTMTIRGTVHEMSHKSQEGRGAPIGCLVLLATEVSSSRGSEFEDLLEGNE